LVTVTGGKWTTCRKMGEDVVDRLEQAQGWSSRPSQTEAQRLHGASDDDSADDKHLRGYGTDGSGILAIEREIPDSQQLVEPGLALRQSEVIWHARSEMARTVEDVLARRTRALVQDARASARAAPVVGRLLARELGWTAEREAQSVTEFVRLAEASLLD
jgi:glycerol-3-phosphate dehydrogenase